jgi:hypothetical protein
MPFIFGEQMGETPALGNSGKKNNIFIFPPFFKTLKPSVIQEYGFLASHIEIWQTNFYSLVQNFTKINFFEFILLGNP